MEAKWEFFHFPVGNLQFFIFYRISGSISKAIEQFTR